MRGLHQREGRDGADPAEADRAGHDLRILCRHFEEKEKEVFEEMRRIILALMVMLTLLTVNVYADEPAVIMNGQYVELHPQADAIDIQEAPPINRISDALDEVDANDRQLEYIGLCTITTYCPCRKCNGHWGAIDGYGNPLVLGTVAVDPKVIPLQTHLIIDGYDIEFVARDTGSGVNGKHIDIFMPVSHSEALRMDQGNKRKVWKVIK